MDDCVDQRIGRNWNGLGGQLWAGILIAVSLCISETSRGQDRVTIRLSDDSQTTVRQGTILDWKGGELQMETAGRVTTIKNEKILKVETNWPKDYQLAQELMEQRQFSAAIAPLQNALAGESREWVRRNLLADLVRVSSVAGQDQKACEAFLQLIQSDPETREFARIPLAWETEPTGAAMLVKAREMAQSSVLIVRLLGASWLVNSPDRENAGKILESLSRDLDARLAHLAAAQLWRLQVLEVDATQLARWERQVDRMPRELRPGALLILGQAQLRLQRENEAILSWMRVPLLYGEHERLKAIALQRTAQQLQNSSDTENARKIWGELAVQFPQSPWSEAAATHLAK